MTLRIMCSWQIGPPAKKTKPNTSKSKTDEEPSWVLDKNRFVKVHEFRGNVYVDIREFYESDGELKPSRKGGCAKKSCLLCAFEGICSQFLPGKFMPNMPAQL
jgi:hypothetical protein